jgi:hypothetical protein
MLSLVGFPGKAKKKEGRKRGEKKVRPSQTRA